MIKQIAMLCLFFSAVHIHGHIHFINTTDEHLFIVDIQLKKSYHASPGQEVLLMTSPTSSHFLLYTGIDDATDSQKNQLPLFSFGTVERMQRHLTIALTTDDLIGSQLPEQLFAVASTIKRDEAMNLINKPAKGCSKCEERRREREERAKQQQQK